MKLPRVIVGLSGGVDSSVSALLLKQAGFDVRGVYLKCYWTHAGCQSDVDRNSAAKVASFLEIPFEVWDFEKEYRQKVVEYFYAEYEKGRTPNPDVVCNREIKFGLFLRKALELDSTSMIATGHYARTGLSISNSELGIKNEERTWVLPKYYQADITPDIKGAKFVDIAKYLHFLGKFEAANSMHTGNGGNRSVFGGADQTKDQSYFLYDIDNSTIEHILFPLGNLLKTRVRDLAKKSGLPTADRPDSSGICFIGEINVEKFLKKRIKPHTGEVINIQERVIGRHQGVEFYTIGQRHGFILNAKFRNQNAKSQLKIQNTEPMYVIRKDIQKNRLVVGAGEECKRGEFTVDIRHSTIDEREKRRELIQGSSVVDQLYVRIRHLGEMIPCEVSVNSWGNTSLEASSPANSLAEVKLAYPVFGVAPGQSAVFYERVTGKQSNKEVMGGEIWRVVGGGVISGSDPSTRRVKLGFAQDK